MAQKNDITAIILAGGKSSRMGSDKGLTYFKEKPFIKHIIEAASPFVKEIIIVSNNAAYDKFDCKRYGDIITDVGPLGGIHSGLTHSKTNVNLVISCDVPMLSTKVIDQLLASFSEDFEVIQTKSNEKTMPLVALYHKNCLPKIEQWLANDRRRVREFVATLNLKTIHIDQQYNDHLLNINTPQQLKKIEHAFAD